VFGAGEQIDWTQSGAEQNAEAAAKGLSLNRIEDGHFDPNHKNNYYFTTTEGGSTAPNPAEPGTPRDGGGLWRLRFNDVERPERGGTLTLLLDGSEAPYLNKPDNITIDDEQNLLIQEDPGGNDHIARIVAYNIDTGERGVLARFDPALFGATNPSGVTPDERAVLTTDEESSGIIATDDVFGDDTYLFDAQVHSAKRLPPGTGTGTVEEYVQHGQLLSMRVGNWAEVYTIG
jgi:secreted PhoX family phosphatase